MEFRSEVMVLLFLSTQDKVIIKDKLDQFEQGRDERLDKLNEWLGLSEIGLDNKTIYLKLLPHHIDDLNDKILIGLLNMARFAWLVKNVSMF
jgi:hypothetical protein